VSDRDAAAEGALVEEFLTAGQREAYGRFEGPPSVKDLQRCFLLDDDEAANWSPSGVVRPTGWGSRCN